MAVTPWSEARTLFLPRDPSRTHGDFTVSPPGTAPPQRTAGAKCPVRLDAEALTALASGEVLLVGRDCDSGDRLALERWAPGKTTATVTPLREPEGKLVEVRLLATEKDRFALVRREQGNFFARVDVSAEEPTLTPLPLPVDKPLVDASLAPDGTVWLLFGKGADLDLLRRSADGTYARATFPAREDYTPYGLYAASADIAYLAVTTSDVRSLILSTRPGDLFEEEAAADDDKPSTPAGGAPGALTAGCPTPFVILFAVSDSAPYDYDYPATRDALSGWPDAARYRFVEYKNGKQRTLGVIAPDAAAAEALAARIREKVKGSRPAPACFKPAAPDTIREVKLAGGA